MQDPSTWSNLTSKSIDYLIRNLPKHFVIINEHMFFTKLPHGELKKREWLMYSNTTGCLYCVPCKLFHPRSDSSFCKGFNDWKNCIRLKEHEQSGSIDLI